MKFVDEYNIRHKRVLLRVDFNVPLNQDGSIADDRRIRETVLTIKHLLALKNKIIIVSHLGRPLKRNAQDSLKKTVLRLHDYLPNYKWHFVPDFMTDDHILKDLDSEEFAVLENIRFYPGEATNDSGFAKNLARLADVYVNDAFGVSHRKVASIVAITSYLPSFGGLLLKKEISMLKKVTEEPKRPFVAVIGGKKISTKIKFISKLIRLADYILLSGGLANIFLAARSYKMKGEVFHREELGYVNYLTSLAKRCGTKIFLPDDVIVGYGPDSQKSWLKSIDALSSKDLILDIGPSTQATYGTIIGKSKTVIWNGPLGYFENPLFKRGTDFIYYAIVLNKGAVSVIGGGDTVAAIADLKNSDNVTHISSSG